MDRSVSRSQTVSATALLIVGSWTSLVGVVITVLAATGDGPESRQDRLPLMLGWVVLLVGGALLLVGLIAKGVALGIRESRDD